MHQIDTTAQFIAAVRALTEKGHSLNEICRAAEIDKRNLCRLLREPDKHTPRPSWLTALCVVFGVSPSFLIIADGPVFRP